MNFAFWRYQLILSLLLLFWGDFFISGGILKPLALNYAIFYPLGFLVGYRSYCEDPRTAYLAALVFNLFSYLMAYVVAFPIESWLIVGVDFVSLFVYLQVGIYFGRRAQPRE